MEGIVVFWYLINNFCNEILGLIMNIQVPQPPGDSVSSLNFSPKANHLVATSWDNQVGFYVTFLSLLCVSCYVTCFFLT